MGKSLRLFIKGKKNGRMMLDSIDNGLLVNPTVEKMGRLDLRNTLNSMKHNNFRCLCVQATNIILHGLPPDVYALFNHQEAAKDIWDRGETLYEYYWRFSQLINDMHTIGMTMQQVQVNTKFLNALPLEWSKFVTDVKLAKSLYTTNYDQFTYSSSAPSHSSQPQQQSVSPQPFISPLVTQQSQAKFPQLVASLAVPTFQQGEDLIECINKEMAFVSAVASRHRGIATTSKGNYGTGQAKVVKCYNCLGEGHMAKQCTAKKFCMQTIPQNSAFQTEDLNAYDLDCDDISSARAVLMANLSSCDSDVFSEESQNAGIQDTNSSAPND
ncbi:integrase, catalytic region, zinc finger, CCHC-type containing protein [Tanacetum coccineum]|uniref:Integrase, catalytic region, zinc finger, CCHC-type containing protein n=1 Tax=Tanacetum coccineum TaxID=301880 RepID=A0ABQ5ABX1_9ASTR